MLTTLASAVKKEQERMTAAQINALCISTFLTNFNIIDCSFDSKLQILFIDCNDRPHLKHQFYRFDDWLYKSIDQ